jgi:putative methionine-R-sulfoxide reductase with GAF domain
MDTKGNQADIEGQIALIKGSMPETYKAIKSKAEEIGNEAFRLVRQGLAGKPCKFYAFERGRVVGTPFQGHPIEADIAQAMVQFGCGFCVVWAEPAATT